MRKLSAILTVLLIIVAFNSCGQADSNRKVPPGASLILDIEGMSCILCAKSLENSLQKLDGITVHDIDAGKGIAMLSFETNKIPADSTLRNTVENAGFRLLKVRSKEKSSQPDLPDRQEEG